MDIQSRPLSGNLGVEILNVDLAEIDGAIADALLTNLQQHALLLFRRQSLHDEDIHRLSAAFGPVEEPPAAKDNHSPRFKSVIYLGNINSLDGTMIRGNYIENTDGPWHSDQAYRQNPATISTLFCVICPESGGGTSFSSTRLGYESLPPALQKQVESLKVRYRRVDSQGATIAEASHAAVLTNPVSGAKTLYVAPNAQGFDGLDAAAAEVLKNKLLSHQLQPEHIYQHKWRMGDMLIYDNAQLLHKRDAFEGYRFLKATRLYASPKRFAVPD
ncbi:MAG: TauD/TfdA family dioxygenase [Chloroflexota bacterium]